jgi:tetratricopeptide (TPR) repeat protein
VFKHALTQDVAYESLRLQQRKDLHRLVAAAVEELYAERLPEYYGMLAYHYERGEEWERGLNYLDLAAESARCLGARRDEAALLARAVAIAERRQERALVGRLRARRGRAFIDIGLWKEARPELEVALEHFDPDDFERRAEALTGLTWSSIWLFDRPGSIRYANEALPVADQAKRDDLVADVTGSLAMIKHQDCQHAEAHALFQRAIQRAGGLTVESLAYAPHTWYALGMYDEGMRLAQEAVQAFQARNKSMGTLLAMSHLGLNLAGLGRYAEVSQVFAEARRFGRQYEIWPLLARCISMSSSYHLDLFDFAGAEALAQEACELARSTNFPAAILSSEIDLVFNFVRRHDVGCALSLVAKVAIETEAMPGWHTWIWRTRLIQARAEIELGRGNPASALRWAENGLTNYRASGRVKYQVLALATHASALHATGRAREAIAELRSALNLIRPIGEPAMFLRVAATLLDIEGDDMLLAEARRTAQRILAALPDGPLRRCFLAGESVRMLGPLDL